MFCGFFGRIFEYNCPGGGVLAQLFCSKGQGFELSLCLGGGVFALSKTFPGGWPGGWSSLELTDALTVHLSSERK